MAFLRKENYHLVDICRLIKNQQRKRRSRRKTDSNFDFSQVAYYSWFYLDYFLINWIC